jgi:hypothetical protein
MVAYQAGATITCLRPGNTSPFGGGSAFTGNLDQPADGEPCTLLYHAPVTFQDQATVIRGTWVSPSHGQESAAIAPNSAGSVVSASGITAATNDVFALYSQDGKYQGGQCLPAGGWQSFCREGLPVSSNADPCVYSQPHAISPATSPPPAVTPYVAHALDGLRAEAGTIHSLPSPNGLVNLPTCFWLDGLGIPDERDFTLLLAGPPDGSGRRIYYTYLIRVFFAGVDWNFDDPFGNDQAQPDPACGQHPQLTAHSYPMISEKSRPDGYYHVTATESYQVTVDLYWTDSGGPHHSALDPGVHLPITVSPPGPYHQYVGQVEGIPYT